jgi:AraC-like DNA-binding protein
METPPLPRTVRRPLGDAALACLTHYPPGLVQTRHGHDLDELSYVLAGELAEARGGGEVFAGPGQVLGKAAGDAHADRFGPSGALVFSLKRAPADDGEVRRGEGRLAEGARDDLLNLIAALALGAGEADAGQAVADLEGLATRTDGPGASPPPSWLEEAREALRDAPALAPVSAIADRVGVDRKHLSLRFRQAFGMPPSVYRLHAMTARGIDLALTGREGLAEAALAAGFADQSHMARAIRWATGLTTTQLRRLLADPDIGSRSSTRLSGRRAVQLPKRTRA